MRDGIQRKAAHPRAPASGRHVLGAAEVNKLADAAFRRDWPGTGVSGRHHSVSAPIQTDIVWFIITDQWRNTGGEVVPGIYRGEFRYYSDVSGVERWTRDLRSGDRVLDLRETGISYAAGDRVPCYFDWFRDQWVPVSLPNIPPLLDLQDDTDIAVAEHVEPTAGAAVASASVNPLSVVFLLERQEAGEETWKVVGNRRVYVNLSMSSLPGAGYAPATGAGFWTPTLGNGDRLRIAAYVALHTLQQAGRAEVTRTQASLQLEVAHRSATYPEGVDSDEEWSRVNAWTAKNAVANLEQTWEAQEREQDSEAWPRQYPVFQLLEEDDDAGQPAVIGGQIRFYCRPGEGWAVKVHAMLTFRAVLDTSCVLELDGVVLDDLTVITDPVKVLALDADGCLKLVEVGDCEESSGSSVSSVSSSSSSSSSSQSVSITAGPADLSSNSSSSTSTSSS